MDNFHPLRIEIERRRKTFRDVIIERKKVGFPVPLTEWFDNLEQIARDLLPKAPWLNQGLVNDLIDESRSDARSGQVLWMFINIEIFRKQYFFKDWEW